LVEYGQKATQNYFKNREDLVGKSRLKPETRSGKHGGSPAESDPNDSDPERIALSRFVGRVAR
jgi:hypothetical protein